MDARIAIERGKQAERTTQYSNNEKTLRQEFGIEPAPFAAESAGSVAHEAEGRVDKMLSRKPAGTPAHVEETP